MSEADEGMNALWTHPAASDCIPPKKFGVMLPKDTKGERCILEADLRLDNQLALTGGSGLRSFRECHHGRTMCLALTLRSLGSGLQICTQLPHSDRTNPSRSEDKL